MAYRIDYGSTVAKEIPNDAKQLRWQTMTAAFLLLFVLLVKWTWPEGTDKLRSYLLPGGEGTQAAIETFVDQINDGETIGQALTVFCRQIIENAETN